MKMNIKVTVACQNVVLSLLESTLNRPVPNLDQTHFIF